MDDLCASSWPGGAGTPSGFGLLQEKLALLYRKSSGEGAEHESVWISLMAF